MKTFERVLIVRANGDCRVLSADRMIHLRLDEVGFNLNITIPDTWGRMQGLINVELPDAPSSKVIAEYLANGVEEETS